jgi:Family of unknown function (DUF6335)
MAKRRRTKSSAKRKAVAKKAVKKAAAKKATAKKAPKKALRKRVLKKAAKKTARPAAKKAAAKKTAKKAAPKRAAAKARKAPSKAARKAPAKAAPRTTAQTRAPKKAARAARPKRATRPAPIRGAIPSSLNVVGSSSSAARSGRADLVERLQDHNETGPAITAGDLDANWEMAYSSGDEAPGGDNPTPDQDVVDEIGHALGIEYEDNEELKGAVKLEERDRHRWELDPASAEDYPDHED